MQAQCNQQKPGGVSLIQSVAQSNPTYKLQQVLDAVVLPSPQVGCGKYDANHIHGIAS
jgi:hypothetical protein